MGNEKNRILIFITFLIILFAAANSLLIENCPCQWITQNWTYFEIVRDVKFLDENTGFYTGSTSAVYGFYETTNSGFNWTQLPFQRILNIQKIDSTTIYLQSIDYNIISKLFRTYNKGQSWDSISLGGQSILTMYFINRDTGWIGLFNGTTTNIYLTTNGGITLQNLSSISSSWVRNLYFLKEKVNGYYVGYCSNGPFVQKTTNSGYNWVTLPVLPNPPYTYPDVTQVTFINKDTGWITNGTRRIFKSTNGGQNWIIQPVPTGNGLSNDCGFVRFSVINKDTIYSDIGNINIGIYDTNIIRGVIFKTMNGGNNWGYQIPDINYPIMNRVPDFINGQTGWFTNTKTTNGGGPIIFTEIKPISVNVPDEYNLKQNYPNPFNSTTVIEFTIPEESEVTMRIYDITGKVVMRIVEGFRLNRGEYKYQIESFNTSGLSSGVYFYRLEAGKFTDTKKLILLK